MGRGRFPVEVWESGEGRQEAQGYPDRARSRSVQEAAVLSSRFAAAPAH
jgi:hypothetical protein